MAFSGWSIIEAKKRFYDLTRLIPSLKSDSKPDVRLSVFQISSVVPDRQSQTGCNRGQEKFLLCLLFFPPFFPGGVRHCYLRKLFVIASYCFFYTGHGYPASIAPAVIPGTPKRIRSGRHTPIANRPTCPTRFFFLFDFSQPAAARLRNIALVPIVKEPVGSKAPFWSLRHKNHKAGFPHGKRLYVVVLQRPTCPLASPKTIICNRYRAPIG